MKIAGRPLSTIATAPFERRHWLAAANMFSVYANPLDAYKRYLLGSGSYPCQIGLRTKAGRRNVSLYSPHDILTVNEILCRHDYAADESDRVVVDFGSNIGISALYFLTRSRQSHVYCHEPLPMNCERLKANLAGFEERYTLDERAVALHDGTAEFGYEPFGRYGGIGLQTGEMIEVECCHALAVLERVLEEHGRIDILKIDIESLEKEILLAIPAEQLHRIKKIYIEARFEANPLAATHRARTAGSVTQFTPLNWTAG